MGKHKIVLRYSDRLRGTYDDAYYSINLPSYLKGNPTLYLETAIFDAHDESELNRNTFNIHLSGAYQPNSFYTGSSNVTDVIHTQKGTFGYNGDNSTHSLCRFQVPKSMLKANTWNVKLSSPYITQFLKYDARVKEYPPGPLLGNTITLSNMQYGNGTYVISQTSSSSTGTVLKAFDKVIYTSNTASTSTSSYAAATGLYLGSNSTTMSGQQYLGDSFTIQMPQSIVLSNFTIYPTVANYQYGMPSTFVLGGSIDGNTWNLVSSQSNVQWTSSNPKTFACSNPYPYNRFRILSLLNGNSNTNNYRGGFILPELQLNGIYNPKAVYEMDLEYPPASMSANQTTFSNLPYGNGQYTASGPTRDPPFQMFDKNQTTVSSYWGGLYGTYAGASNGNFYGNQYTTMTGVNYYGLPFQIELPVSIILSSYSIQCTSDYCKSITQWVLGGSSNGGATWELLDYAAQQNWDASYSIRTQSVNTTNPYKMFKIVAMTVGNTVCTTAFRDIPSIGEWKLFGKQVPLFKDYVLTFNIDDE